MSQQSGRSSGNAKKEGLGFDGFTNSRLKAKKLTKEKLLTRKDREEEAPRVSQEGLAGQVGCVDEGKKKREEVAAKGGEVEEDSRARINGKKSKGIRKCL
jgi:hypothetical protein